MNSILQNPKIKRSIFIFIALILLIIIGEGWNFSNSLSKINDLAFLEKSIQGKKQWTAIESTLSKDKIDEIIKSTGINYHMTRSFYLKEENIDIFLSYSWKENKCMISAKSRTLYKKFGDLIESTFPVDMNWSAFTHKKYATKDNYCNLVFGYGQIN